MNRENPSLDVLTAIARAMLPEEVLQYRPAEVVAARVWELIQANPNATLRADFEQAIRLLHSSFGAFIFFGKTKPFTRYIPSEAESVLKQMANSRSPIRRRAFQAFKRLIMLVAYGDTIEGSPNPLWKELGFPGAPRILSVPEKRKWQPLALNGEQALNADYIIVGSGAGGSVVAAALAEQGFDVLVLEKGYDCPAAESGLNELEGLNRYFLNQGILTTRDLGITILAGSAVGGGTTINWTTCMRAPGQVFEEWQREHGLTEWNSELFDRLYDEVEKEMGITEQTDPPNRPNALLKRGCEVTGLEARPTKRNVNTCRQRCGFCTFGCPFGSKQSTPLTYLEWAAQHGMQLLPHANVRKISDDHLDGYYTGADGETYPFTARAGRAVVLAAGALETPALLMRSFRMPQAGRNLYLHPTAVVVGYYNQPVHPWEGAPQSMYCDTLLDLDGKGYGVLLETPAMYPGIGAAALAWEGRNEHWDRMKRMRHSAAFLAIARDCSSGRARLGKDGEPVFEYRLHKKTAKHLIQGMMMLLTVHFGAGAVEATTLHQPPVRVTREQFAALTRERSDWHARFLNTTPNRLPLYSAHQMGSCRASGNRAMSVTDPTGKVWDTRNLYIADASLFPTALGVNPMLTIMAAAKWVASNIP